MTLVDFAMKVLNVNNRQCMFQKDGTFYILSENGFAMFNGINVNKYNDIIDAQNVISEYKEDIWGNKTPVFLDDEKEVFELIMNKNSNIYNSFFSLKKLQSSLSKIEDDKKIRIINHYYHSSEGDSGSAGHFYINIQDAKVADRNKFIGLIKKIENDSLNNLEYILKNFKRTKIGEYYWDKKISDYDITPLCEDLMYNNFPSCTIVVPGAELTVPFMGGIVDTTPMNSVLYDWNNNTKFDNFTKKQLDEKKSPFQFNIKFASQTFTTQKMNFVTMKNDISIKNIHFLDLVNENKEKVDDFLNEVNNIYDKVFPFQ